MSRLLFKCGIGRRHEIPPLNLIPPQISGVVEVGQTLTRVPGQWAGYPPFELALQWQADAMDIEGETGTTLDLDVSLEGAVITVTETPVGVEGDPAISDATIPVAPEGGAIAEATVLWVGRAAQGSGDGSDLANRASLSTLPTIMEFMNEVAVGGEDGIVKVYNEGGTHYTGFSSIEVKHGGTVARPVVIMGVDSNGDEITVEANYPIIRGTRTDWTLPLSEQPLEVTGGAPGFIYRDAAQWIETKRLHIRRFGKAVDFTTPTVAHPTDGFLSLRGLEFRDLYLYNNSRGIVASGGTGDSGAASSTWSVRDFVFERITQIGYANQGFQLRGNSRDGQVNDCDFDSGWQFSSGSFPVGFHLETYCRNIDFNDCIARNSYQDNGPNYWNGDGFGCEATYDIGFYRCEAYGCTDAGFDCKQVENGYFEDCHSEDNKKNYRMWQHSVLQGCVSVDPFKRGGNSSANHLWTGSTSDVHAHDFTASGAGAVFLAEGAGANLTIHSGDVSATTGTLETESGGGVVTIDPSVILP